MMGVVFDRNDPSGNIFAIMGKARQVMTIEGRKQDADHMVTRVTHSGSYEEALEIIAEYVDLIEV